MLLCVMCHCSTTATGYKPTCSNKLYIYTGHTQKNGAVLIVFSIKTAPFFCVCPVYIYTLMLDEITQEG
jgi:hypothetical protein